MGLKGQVRPQWDGGRPSNRSNGPTRVQGRAPPGRVTKQVRRKVNAHESPPLDSTPIRACPSRPLVVYRPL